ncbi:MAG: O-antigen ligase family protein [bacterium]|nr:O-antigen ligase family protein [bacterium]
MYRPEVFLYAALLILPLIFIALANTPPRIFLSFCFFISVIPLEQFRRKVYGIPIGINDYHVAAGLLICILFAVIYTGIKFDNLKKKKIDIPLLQIFLTSVIAVYMTIGFLRGYEIVKILRGTLILLMYVIPFIFISIYEIKEREFYFFLLLATFFVSIEYFVMYRAALSVGVLTRVVTRMATITIISFPAIIFNIADGYLSKKNRFLYYAIMFFCLSAAILSLQRSLWVCILFDLCVFVIYLFFISKKKLYFIFRLAIVIFIVLTLLVIAVQIFKAVFGESIFNLLMYRFTQFSFSSFSSDRALSVRMEDYAKIWQIFSESNFIGVGLGAVYMQSDTGKTQEFVDNSYLVLLWKTGIFGFIAVLSMYLFTMIELVKIYVKEKNVKEFLIPGVILLNYLLNGAVDSNFVMYNQTIWIGMLMLMIHQKYRRVYFESGFDKHGA